MADEKRFSRRCPNCGTNFTCVGVRGDGSICPGLKEGESCLCPKCWSNMTGFPSTVLSCVVSERQKINGYQEENIKN